MEEYISSVELEFSVWMIQKDPLVGEVWVLPHFRDEYEGVAWEVVVDAEVGYFSTFRDGR